MKQDTKHADLASLRIDRIDHSLAIPAKGSTVVRRYIFAGVIVLGILGGISAGAHRISPKPLEVRVTRAVTEGSAKPRVLLNASGYIVAHHKISVNSKVTGLVAWIGVEKGEQVKRHQELVRLEEQEFRAQVDESRGLVKSAEARLRELQAGSRPEEIEGLANEVAEASAIAENDRLTLERTKSLVGDGILSRQLLDDTTTRFETSSHRAKSIEQKYTLAKLGPRKEQVERARGDLLQAQGRLDFAKSQLEATVIRAPIAGTILERTAEKGELVTAQFASGTEGGPRGSVVALADLTDLQVELEISQDDFSKLQTRPSAVIRVDAFPDRKYDGMIAQVSPEANRQKATVQVRVQIAQPDTYLRPDMNATVEFVSADMPANSKPGTSALVPASAVHDRPGRPFVYIAAGDKVYRRDVHIVGEQAADLAVEGLVDGENVIITISADLREGKQVSIKGQP
jgi:HlyD family secretion protein